MKKGGSDVTSDETAGEVEQVLEEITSLYPGLKRLKKQETAYLKEDFALLLSHGSDQMLELKRLVLRILAARADFSHLSNEASQEELGVQLKVRSASEEAQRLMEQIEKAKKRLDSSKVSVESTRDVEADLMKKIKRLAVGNASIKATIYDLHGHDVDDLLSKSTVEMKSFNERLEGFAVNVHEMVAGMQKQQESLQQRLIYVENQYNQVERAKVTRSKAVAGLEQLERLVDAKRAEIERKKEELNALMIRAKRREAHNKKLAEDKKIRLEQQRIEAIERAKSDEEARKLYAQQQLLEMKEREAKAALARKERLEKQKVEANRLKEEAAAKLAAKAEAARLERERVQREREEEKIRLKREKEETMARRARERVEKAAMIAREREEAKARRLRDRQEAIEKAQRDEEKAAALTIKANTEREFKHFKHQRERQDEEARKRREKEKQKQVEEAKKEQMKAMKDEEAKAMEKEMATKLKAAAEAEEKEFRDKRKLRQFEDEEHGKLRTALQQMDSCLLDEKHTVKMIDRRIAALANMQARMKKNKLTGPDVDLVDKYLDEEDDEMGVFATRLKIKKMEETVNKLVKKVLIDKQKEADTNADEGEGSSPFNLSSVFGFFGNGFQGHQVSVDEGKKYAIG